MASAITVLARRLCALAVCSLLVVPVACSGNVEDPTPVDPAGNPNDTGAATDDAGSETTSETASGDLCSKRDDGDYCGSIIGGDATTLYHCKGNAVASNEVCKDGCYNRLGPAGKDACGSDAVDPCFNDPDGRYCGGAIGGDAGTLYTCKDKHTASAEKCVNGCWSSPPPAGGDACLSDAVEPCWNDPDGAYCGDSIGGPAGKVYHCKDKKTASIEVCTEGCQKNPAGVPDTCAGVLSCSNEQWWNTYLTYGPYMSYGWWDTDLGVKANTPVVLRHASRLDKHGVYGWGYMPEFTDLTTGKRFRFLHLRPAAALMHATVDGTVYPTGFVVGLSGGDTADTGMPTYSTGAHLCVQTLDAYRTCFPTGKDPCK